MTPTCDPEVISRVFSSHPVLWENVAMSDHGDGDPGDIIVIYKSYVFSSFITSIFLY